MSFGQGCLLRTMSPGLIPLDGAATSMKAGSVYAGRQVNLIDGANSIGG